MIGVADRALEIGKAGEHIACADLIMHGYHCFLTGQGLPYDLAVEVDDKLLRVQVKATLAAKNVSANGRPERICYCWNIRSRGKKSTKRLDDSQCDIVALVALDTKSVAYFPIGAAAQTIQLLSDDAGDRTGSGRKGWSRKMSQFTFEAAVRNDPSFYFHARGQVTHCPSGHAYEGDNVIFGSNGYKACRECSRRGNRERARRIRGLEKLEREGIAARSALGMEELVEQGI